MFDRIICINLRRRPDRWQRFLEQIPLHWPFPRIERVDAVDGKAVGPPGWYGVPPAKLNHLSRDWGRDFSGAWGCLQSHLRAWEESLSTGVTSLLVFEDDAAFDERFVEDAQAFLAEVSTDWDQLYFGGEHLKPPEQISDYVLRCRNVNRTHAYAMRAEMMQAAYHAMLQHDAIWRPQDWHIDHRLGRLHGEFNIYAPVRWLVGQAAGKSDIRGDRARTAWWNSFHVNENRQTDSNRSRQTAGV